MPTFNSNTSVVYKLRLEVTQQSQNVSTNTSTLKWTLHVDKSNSIYGLNSTSNGDWFRVTIDGKNVFNKQVAWNIYNKSSVQIASGTTTVNHTSDGSKSVKIEAKYSPTYSTVYYPSTMYLSSSMSLTKIPRASSFSLYKNGASSKSTSFEIFDDLRIGINTASSSFTHDIKWNFGGKSGTLATGIKSSFSWNFNTSTSTNVKNAKDSWLITLSNSNTGTGKFIVTTKNGSATLGSKELSFTVNVSTDSANQYKPDCVFNENIDESTGRGIFIQNVSSATWNVDWIGKLGSKVTKITATVNGRTYNGSISDSTASVTVDKFTESGNNDVVISIYDGRGSVQSSNYSIDVKEYNPPKIWYFDTNRCLSNGSLDEDGTNVLCKFSITFDSLCVSDNSAEMAKNSVYIYREDNLSPLFSLNGVVGQKLSIQDKTFIDKSNIQADKSYQYRIEATDLFGNTSIFYSDIPITFSLMDLGAGGKSIAFGKASSDQGSLEISMPISLYGEAVQSLMSFIYPVGSIYTTRYEDNPSVRFGGVWVQIGLGRVLIGAGTGNDGSVSRSFSSGSTGGKYSHTLSVTETPWKKSSTEVKGYGLPISGAFENRVAVSRESGTESFDVTQPYLVAYFWERVTEKAEFLSSDDFELGSVHEGSAKGTDWSEVKMTTNTRIRTKKLIPFSEKRLHLISLDNLQTFYCWFDENKKYLGQSSGTWQSSTYQNNVPTGTKYFALVLRHQDQSATNISDVKKGVVYG